MRRALLLLLAVSAVPFTGCDALQKKHDNPVMTAAPRRVEKVEHDDSTTLVADNDSSDMKEDDGSNIVQIKRELIKKNPWDNWEDDTAIFNSQVAATVNGVPILNGDILDQWTVWLQGQREQMQKAAGNPKLLQPGAPVTPDDYDRLRYMVISANINQAIQNKLLAEHLKSGLKAEQMKLMESHIDEQFAKRIEELKKVHKVTNKTELELELRKKGTTLDNVRNNFALQLLAQECVGIKSEKPKPIERPDLVAYYQAHIDDFNTPARLKWQQVQVSFGSGTGAPKAEKDAARKKLEEAITELKSGVSFDQVAKEYSDGSTAKDGGQWDWLEAGNLADSKLEKKLFSMRVGQLSDIHEGPSSYSVVRVTEKQAAGRKPLKEVQDEIRDNLQKEQNQKRFMKFMQNIYSKAIIETHYELKTPSPDS